MCVCACKNNLVVSKTLLYVQFKCLKDNIFIRSWFISAEPHFNVITSTCWQLLHKPRRVVEGTASVEWTTALAIPERVIGVKYVCISLCAGSITKVVIANIRRDWYGSMVVNVCAGTK